MVARRGAGELVRSRLQGLGPGHRRRRSPNRCAPAPTSKRRSRGSRARAWRCSGSYTPGAASANGATARCSRASIATRSSACARRSSRCPRRTSCASCFAGSTSRRASSGRGPTRSTRSSRQLQGFEAPAAAWESELLPARLENYDFTWLDDLCLSGRAVWTRLTHAGCERRRGRRERDPHDAGDAAAAAQRGGVDARRAGAPRSTRDDELRAQAVADFLRAHGASFYDEIVDGTRLLRTQVEDALGELVALGRATSDSFAGLRALLTPSQKRKPLGGGKPPSAHGAARHRRRRPVGAHAARAGTAAPTARRGRAPRRRTSASSTSRMRCCAATASCRGAFSSAKRHGCRRGASLLRVLRRLEARGDIRGGRFVASIPASSSRCPKRWRCCAKRAARRSSGRSCRSAPRTR